MDTLQSKSGSAVTPSPAAVYAAAGVAFVAPVALSSPSSDSSYSGLQPEISLPDGSRYRGELSSKGKPHGRGLCQFASGAVYEGSFKDGLFDGIGVYLWPDGGRYEGEFAGGDFSGLGARWDKDGKLSKCGRWANDNLVEGCAVMLWLISEGKFLSAAAKQAECDHPNESALMPNGSYYIGELNKQGQPHGQGASFHPDGSPFVQLLVDAADASQSGCWVDGKLQGRATWTSLDGDRYDGAFKDSLFDGPGVLRRNDGGRHEGEFVAGKSSGLGAEWNQDGKLIACGRWADHRLVEWCAVPLRLLSEGKWLSAAAKRVRRDHPHHSLVVLDNKSRFYIGEVNQRGQPHGHGAEFYPNGSPLVTLSVDAADASQTGCWVDAKVQGRATLINPNGDRYDGAFKDTRFDGLGVYLWRDGARYEGEFAAGERSGLGACWNKDGKVINCGRWENNKLVESCAVPLRLLPEGKYLSAAALQAKRDHPRDSALTPYGTHYIGSLNDRGQPHGQGASFHPDGSPAVTLLIDKLDWSKCGRWDDGKVQGRATWISVYGDRYDGAFKESRFDGVGVYRKYDGSRYEGEFAADEFSGLGAKWNKDGKFAWCGRWANDKPVESRAVPMRCLPEGKLLSPAARQAKREHPEYSALLPSGQHYIGPLNAEGQPHGVGSVADPDGTDVVTPLLDQADVSKSGCWVDGRLQGRATQVCPNGDRFEGLFKGGLYDGLGIYNEVDNGVRYEYNDLCKGGRFDGSAVFGWQSGGRYEGEFVAGQRRGLGAEWSKEGKLVKCGRWANHQIEETRAVPLSCIPDGEYLSAAAKQAKRDHPNESALMPNGSHYIGELNEHGQPHRQGSVFHSDCSSCITLLVDVTDPSNSGRFVDGKLQGRATCSTAAGNRLEGSFKDGSLEGLGIYGWNDGRLYEGEFAEGEFSGLGAKWDDDGKLVNCGRWIADKFVLSSPVPMRCIPEGKHLSATAHSARQLQPHTTLLLASGGHYTGAFDAVTLQLHGVGIEFDSAGEEHCNGNWVAGDFTEGRMRCPDGEYNGAVQDGQRDGFGTLTLHSGATIEAVWSEGRAASGSYTATDGSRFEGGLLLNRPHGIGVRWTAQGVMLECGEFVEGSLRRSCAIRCSQLPFRKFVPLNATLLYPDHRYYCGAVNAASQRHGQGSLFREGGSEESSGEWVQDRRFTVGELVWKDGRYRGAMLDNVPNGLGQLRYPNKDLFEGDFVNGERIGLGILWNAKGAMIKCGSFRKRRFTGLEKFKSTPVPRSKLLYAEQLSERARTSSLLFPDGGFHVGPLNARFLADGMGKLYSATGVLLKAGLWVNGVLVQSAVVAALSASAEIAAASKAPTAPAPRRWALVLWNSQYQPAMAGGAMPEPIPAVELSALDVIDCLQALKFKVERCRNGTQHEMKAAIRKFVSRLRSRDLVFIYFCGHGAMVDRETYLLPTDLGSDSVSENAISVQYIRNKISRCYESQDCEKLTVVMALDCCRNETVEVLLSEDSCADSDDEANDLVGSVPQRDQPEESGSDSELSTTASCHASISRSLHTARASRSVKAADLAECNQLAANEWFIMYATEPRLKTWTDASLGFFTRALLQHLPTPGLEIGAMFKRVNAMLVKDARQSAHCENTLHKDLFLAGLGSSADAPAEANAAAAVPAGSQLAPVSAASAGSRSSA